MKLPSLNVTFSRLSRSNVGDDHSEDNAEQKALHANTRLFFSPTRGRARVRDLLEEGLVDLHSRRRI